MKFRLDAAKKLDEFIQVCRTYLEKQKMPLVSLSPQAIKQTIDKLRLRYVTQYLQTNKHVQNQKNIALCIKSCDFLKVMPLQAYMNLQYMVCLMVVYDFKHRTSTVFDAPFFGHVRKTLMPYLETLVNSHSQAPSMIHQNKLITDISLLKAIKTLVDALCSYEATYQNYNKSSIIEDRGGRLRLVLYKYPLLGVLSDFVLDVDYQIKLYDMLQARVGFENQEDYTKWFDTLDHDVEYEEISQEEFKQIITQAFKQQQQKKKQFSCYTTLKNLPYLSINDFSELYTAYYNNTSCQAVSDLMSLESEMDTHVLKQSLFDMYDEQRFKALYNKFDTSYQALKTWCSKYARNEDKKIILQALLKRFEFLEKLLGQLKNIEALYNDDYFKYAFSQPDLTVDAQRKYFEDKIFPLLTEEEVALVKSGESKAYQIMRTRMSFNSIVIFAFKSVVKAVKAHNNHCFKENIYTSETGRKLVKFRNTMLDICNQITIGCEPTLYYFIKAHPDFEPKPKSTETKTITTTSLLTTQGFHKKPVQQALSQKSNPQSSNLAPCSGR